MVWLYYLLLLTYPLQPFLHLHPPSYIDGPSCLSTGSTVSPILLSMHILSDAAISYCSPIHRYPSSFPSGHTRHCYLFLLNIYRFHNLHAQAWQRVQRAYQRMGCVPGGELRKALVLHT